MWHYRGKEIYSHDDLEPNCTDFVYVIVYEGGQRYIGKKAIRSIRRKPPLKGKKRNRRIMTNLPFINYQGSHEHAKDLIAVEKRILFQCSLRKTATYIEIALLIEFHAIFDDNYINENISGTLFRNSLDGLMPEDAEAFDFLKPRSINDDD